MTAVSASDIEQTDADTDVIAVSNNDVLGDGVDSGTFSDLQDKINNAGEGSTIELLNNYTYGDAFLAGGIIINKSITIEGNGFTIDGANQARIFFINATEGIVLNNIVFANAISTQGGAILFNKNVSDVIISNSIFRNNSLSHNEGAGGAINFNNDASMVLFENDTFENNHASLGYGGNIAFDKYATLVQFNGCDFRVNKPRQDNIAAGGAIYFIKDAVMVIINNCEFDNLTAYTGGAIFVEGNMDHCTFEETYFINNTAFTKNTKYGGGAIAVEGNATNNIFNEALFTLNTGFTHGGTINFMANAINNTFVDCEFIDNCGKYGSAIAVNKNTENLNITGSTFVMSDEPINEVIGGGEIYFINNVCNLNINDCYFTGNIARAGGAISVEKRIEKSLIENTIFENNEITTANKNYGGGTIFIEDTASDLIIKGCDFINNIASTFGGAIYINVAENVLIDYSFFANNTAKSGNAIYIKDGSNVTIQNSGFINNTGSDAGIIFKGEVDASIINSTFEGGKYIFIGEDSAVTLSNNEELYAYDWGDYFVYNEGILSLENNMLINKIYNMGTITSPTRMISLANMTLNETDPYVALFADCYDDNYNCIVSDYGEFHINDMPSKAFYDDELTLHKTINFFQYGSYIVNATMHGILTNCTYEYGIINIIPKNETNISASDIELNIGEYGEIEVTLPENATGIVTADINNETYLAVVKDGKATIIIPPLEAGEYIASIYYSGDDYYQDNQTTCLITVLDEITVDAPDITKYYHGPERFVVNVAKSGIPVVNASVEITINSVTYTRQTDENGSASMGLNLESGNYTATVKVDDVEVNSTVTILPTVNGTDITKVYRNATQYYATFRDSEGKYLADGTAVQFNINGVMYTRYINGSDGKAGLNLNLEQGEYIITAINPNTTENAANNITILSKIINNNDLVKYYRNDSQYYVQIIGDDGNPVGANVTVKFNINGVFYERQSNESGIAKLNINLEPGDYVITAEYEGCMVSNNITVLPVLTAENLTKVYGTDDPFISTLVDGQGKPYTDQKIEFNINGVLYYRFTDSQGIAKLNINLQSGEYIITSAYEFAVISNKITVKS